MLSPPAEGNSYDTHGKSLKSVMGKTYWVSGQNWPHNKKTFTPLAVGLQMIKKLIFPSSGIYNSQQPYHSRLLWFKIITPTRLTLVRYLIWQTWRVPGTQVINQLKWLETRHHKHWASKGKRFGAMQSITKHINKNEIQATTRQGGVACYPKFWRVSHHTAPSTHPCHNGTTGKTHLSQPATQFSAYVASKDVAKHPTWLSLGYCFQILHTKFCF
jgi:hypothetical protein